MYIANCMLTCTVGWSDFEEKNATHSMLCQIVVGPQFQKFMSQCCLFPWPQKIWTVTLKSAIKKMFFKPATGGNGFFDFFKAKNEERKKKNILTLYRSKKVLPIFGK